MRSLVNHRLARCISVILAFAIVFRLVPSGLTRSASAAPAGPADKPTVSRQRELFPGRGVSRVELAQWRNANTRHFLNPDGTFTAEVYRDSINYQDPVTRAWKPIDNNLKSAREAGFAFPNGANRYDAHFLLKAGAGTLARFKLGESYVDFSPVQAGLALGQVRGNSVTYNTVYPDVDLKYETLSDKLKESIILNSVNVPDHAAGG